MSRLFYRSVSVSHFFVVCACCAICFSFGSPALAQTTFPLDGRNQGRPDVIQPRGIGGALGGVTANDFQPLLDLIKGVVDTDIWDDGGGAGSIQPYPQGVFADAEGTLRFEAAKKPSTDGVTDFVDDAKPQSELKTKPPAVAGDVRLASKLRFVSLPRLEAALTEYVKQRKALPPEVLTLAGLQRIQYVLVVPETDQQPGDLILAGPAGDWETNDDGIIVSQDHGQPVVRIDDLLTLWRRSNPTEPFGVTINPSKDGLAAMQNYVTTTTTKPIKRSKRDKWVDGIRKSVGKQDVQFFNLQPDSHVAKTLLTADYHMKCIGMGVAEPVKGVESYLSTVKLGPDGKVPPMSVLRWWFAMNYQPVAVSDDNQAFELRGEGAKVLSENQLMAARGERVRTGKSEALNTRFAASFSRQFGEICEEYPLYGELRNVFDLSLTLALIEKQGLLDRAGWQPKLLLDPVALRLPKFAVAREVDTIANYEVLDKKVIVAGVSGGVWVDAKKQLASASDSGNQAAAVAGDLASVRPKQATAKDEIVWWWDRP